MKNKLIALILILVVAVFVTPEITKVYAATTSHANQANSSSGKSLNKRLKVESAMTAHGSPMKITLYLCKTNNVPRDANGKVLAPKDIGINEFIKFGKSIIVGTDSNVGYPGAYINIDTCKLDQLSKQIAPAYTSKSISSIGGVTDLGIPAWGDSDCNAANQTDIKNYFTCAGDNSLKNLNKIINEVAKKSSGKTGPDAISSTLSKIKQTDFNYIGSNGQKMNLTYKNIISSYGETNYVANWLVVMEPMFTYKQDPYGYFGTKSKVATMTATDAVLANKVAGQTGAAFKYKFSSSSPAYNAIVRYCDECDKTWFAYAKSGTPSIATYCPLPCSSIGPYEEKSGKRYPFSINPAVRAAAKAWQLSDTWLEGYAKAKALGSKPNEDEILAYGGYSIYFLGPKVQPKPTPTPSITPSPTPTPIPVTSAGNVIAENELVKAIQSDAAPGSNVSRVSVEKTSIDTTCPGTKEESYAYYVSVTDTKGNVTSQQRTGTRTVNCDHPHTIDYAKGITPKSLTVQPQWYWNESMFGDLSRLSVLRNSGTLKNDGVTFAFNTSSQFTTTNMSNAFGAELINYRFLAHRNAQNSEKPLQLAAYMNNTPENKAFQFFILPYFGKYPSAFSAPNGNFGGKDINVMTSSTLSGSVTATGSGSFCSGGSSDSLSIPSQMTGSIILGKTTVEDNTFKTTTNITVEPTISEKSRSSKSLATESVYYNTGSNMAFITRFQSQQISFYPAFKMAYDTNNEGTNSSEVWMLANGKREFMSYDTFSYEVLDSKIQVDAPWSRDAEDRWEDPKASQRVARTIPTLKSGSAIKADASGTVLRITVNVHLQDPAFVSETERAALQAKNDQIIDGYDSKVKNIIAKIKNGGVSYFSNLLQAAAKDTLNFIPSNDKVIDLSAKTTLRLAEPVIVNTSIYNQVSYLDNNDTADYDPTGKRNITIKGRSLPLKHWEDNNVIQSNQVLSDLLVKNGGNLTSGWYTESYEGVIIVTRTYLLEISNCSSSYAQVHPALSDSLTPRNQLAHELKFSADKKITLIEEGQFGIGLEVRFPEITLGGVTHTPVLCSSAYLLDVRGSVYDTAAN